MIKKRAIIIAAGNETRWGGYMGIHKHFLEIDGEPILKRTVRLLNEAGVDDVWVVGKTDEYKINGSRLYIPKFTPEYYDADKFLSSRDLWLRDEGKTMVLYGDCYFTKHAIDLIVSHKHHDWLLFARPFKSYLTRNDGECFAQTFYPGQVDEHERALFKLIDFYNSGRLDRIGGWEHYRLMSGLPEEFVDRHFIGDRFVLIDDWTDDFDKPQHYNKFLQRREEVRECPLCSQKTNHW